MTDWKVGDKAVEVITLNTRGEPRISPITVVKVARKWVSYQIDGSAHKSSRFDFENGFIDGGQYSSPGRVYRSEDEYHETTRMDRKWNHICKRVPWTRPHWLSNSDIDFLATMLRINGDTP